MEIKTVVMAVSHKYVSLQSYGFAMNMTIISFPQIWSKQEEMRGFHPATATDGVPMRCY